MQITNKIKIYLDENRVFQELSAVQGDTARAVEVSLYTEGTAWTVPTGAKALVRYRKPDGVGGAYDTLPDGSQAWSASGNTVTVALAPQVLTVAGTVKLQVALVQGEEILSTFTVNIRVQADPSVGALESKEYTNLQQWISKELKSQMASMYIDLHSEIPTKVSQLENDSEYATQSELKAKLASMYSDLHSEIPTGVSQLENDADYATREELPAAFYVTVTANSVDGTCAADKTLAELTEAYNAGDTLYCVYNGWMLPLCGIDSAFCSFAGVYRKVSYSVSIYADEVKIETVLLAENSSIPTALHNPNKLVLTGAVEAEYDGSGEVTVEIPTAAGGSGVYVGTGEPEDSSVNVWIDPDDDETGEAETGGTTQLRVLNDITVEETVDVLLLSEDDSGTPYSELALSKVIFALHLPQYEVSSFNTYVYGNIGGTDITVVPYSEIGGTSENGMTNLFTFEELAQGCWKCVWNRNRGLVTEFSACHYDLNHEEFLAVQSGAFTSLRVSHGVNAGTRILVLGG